MQPKNRLDESTQTLKREFSHDQLARYVASVVARYNAPGLFVSTIQRENTNKPFETAVSHLAYRGIHPTVTVEAYDTYDQALEGHMRWYKLMTSDRLPDTLVECRNDPEYALIHDAIYGVGKWETLVLQHGRKAAA